MALRLLIVSRYRDADEVGERVLGRRMLEALDRRGIGWRLHRPWLPDPDLSAYDAALFWSYRYDHHNYPFWARQLELRCRERGLPVINGVEHCRAPHSFFLQAWRAAGVPCARCQRFARVEDIALDYPLILRRDGVHMGQDVVRVDDPAAARAVVDARHEELLRGPARRLRSGNFDLAIEFVDTRDAEGIYRKWRAIVIGERVIPRHLLLSRDWLVNFGNLVEGPRAVAEDRAFQRDGVEDPQLVRRAARMTGADIVALDYGRRRDGSYVFWEANRHFLLLGDPGYQTPEKFQAATGRDDAQRRAEDRALGQAIADLVASRVPATA